MCVIVHQPAGAHLEKDRAERLWKKNPHGGGFAFIDDNNELKGWKTMDFKTFWKSFETSRSQFPNRDFLLHMRIATHGAVNLDNVHPFQVDEHTLMAHNGIIHGAPEDPTGKKSDTRMFIDEVLPRLPDQWLDDPYIVEMVEGWIGWSKLMFLTTDPLLEKTVYILNEKSGVEADGMWFSNSSGVHESKTYTTYLHKRADHAKTKNGKSPATLASEDVFNWAWEDYPVLLSSTEGEVIADSRREMATLLAEVRRDDGLTKRVQWVRETDTIECWGCDETVDEDTGECMCWDKVCMDCYNVAGLCVCSPGWSSNLKMWDETNEDVRDQALKGG